MRRDSGTGAEGIGGAWHCAAVKRIEEPIVPNASEVGRIARSMLANETVCADAGCTKGACIVGIDLQQSWLWCPCEEHGIEPQHCMAWSGVIAASQSNPYAARAAASTTKNSAFEIRITL